MSTSSTSHAIPDTALPLGKRETERRSRRERLLDAAEHLFAAAGYEAIGLRDITAAAGTRLASVTEEFGGKEQLFREVLMRRALPLEDERLRLLDDVVGESAGSARVAAIVSAFVDPMLARAADGEGWRDYFRFIAQLANSRQIIQLVVAEEYNRLAHAFIDAFRATYPDVDDESAQDAYLFMLASSLEVFANSPRLDSLSSGKYRSDDLERRCTSLRRFVTAGIDAVLNPQSRT